MFRHYMHSVHVKDPHRQSYMADEAKVSVDEIIV